MGQNSFCHPAESVLCPTKDLRSVPKAPMLMANCMGPTAQRMRLTVTSCVYFCSDFSLAIFSFAACSI
jgi:hypothetical protein